MKRVQSSDIMKFERFAKTSPEVLILSAETVAGGEFGGDLFGERAQRSVVVRRDDERIAGIKARPYATLCRHWNVRHLGRGEGELGTGRTRGAL